MSNLITLENVSLAYGLDPLLDKVKLQISKGERVCLIGRNGAGKSSLLKIIEGTVQPDAGTVWRKPGLRIARLEQELPRIEGLTIYEYVAQGLAGIGETLAKYHALTQSAHPDLRVMEKLQQIIDAENGWQYEQAIETILTRLALNPEQLLHELSGGWQRRAALGKALIVNPDLLLLDEPTNHLDVEAIEWLEDHLLSSHCGLLFITHDRAMLRRLATRILELDRGVLTSWPGNYDQFLLHKEELLHAEEKHNADFDKKLAQEEKWIRQGIKARRTRNEGRVRALEAMREKRAKRINVQGPANFNVNEGESSGKLVVDAENISFQYQDKVLVKNFTLRLMRGDRIGLVGPNGIGKTTLIHLLIGKIKPTSGTVKIGTKLQIAYFDQLRKDLDLEKSVKENVLAGSETIEVNGKKQHIVSYLNNFLFTPQRAMTPVKALSGGECNRLLLAKLFSQPANLLIMDEPTNDLDVETLELLEELLANFNGTLILVSHDREFLDNVVTSTLVFSGEGRITEYVGGYQDALLQMKNVKPTAIKKVEPEKKDAPNKSTTKLSYNQQREYDALPKKIEELESGYEKLTAIVTDANFYQKEPAFVAEQLAKLKTVETEINAAYTRWEELENIINGV